MSDLNGRILKLETRTGRHGDLPKNLAYWTDGELQSLIAAPGNLPSLKRLLSKADFRAIAENRWDDVSDEALQKISDDTQGGENT